jgi:hypothetical protein
MNRFLTYLLTLLSFDVLGGNTDPVLSQRQKDVIVYFKEVALGFEYGSASAITRKWKGAMKVYVAGKPTPSLLTELDRVIEELNSLATDGFHIEIVAEQSRSNFEIFFGSRPEFVAGHPMDSETVKGSSGIFRIFWNRENRITRGYIFIHTATSEQEQKHAIREELTQSLGLGKDSPLHSDSIFQTAWTIPTEFAEIDRDLVRILYHPRVTAGLSADEVESIITEIFLAQAGTM